MIPVFPTLEMVYDKAISVNQLCEMNIQSSYTYLMNAIHIHYFTNPIQTLGITYVQTVSSRSLFGGEWPEDELGYL